MIKDLAIALVGAFVLCHALALVQSMVGDFDCPKRHCETGKPLTLYGGQCACIVEPVKR